MAVRSLSGLGHRVPGEHRDSVRLSPELVRVGNVLASMGLREHGVRCILRARRLAVRAERRGDPGLLRGDNVPDLDPVQALALVRAVREHPACCRLRARRRELHAQRGQVSGVAGNVTKRAKKAR